MSKFYQHLEIIDNNTSNTKVTKLKYVDDISDDEMTLYVFEDGSKCNEQFIGTVKETDPKLNRRVFIELYGPQYRWTIERHEVKASTKKMKADDGIIYEAPDPGVHVSGMGGQNLQITQDLKEGIRIDFIPPKTPLRYEYDPIDNYRLSLHPELEFGKPGKNLLKTKTISTDYDELPILTEIDETTIDSYWKNKQEQSQATKVPATPEPAYTPAPQQPVQQFGEYVPTEEITIMNDSANKSGLMSKPCNEDDLMSKEMVIDFEYLKSKKIETVSFKKGDLQIEYSLNKLEKFIFEPEIYIESEPEKNEDEDDLLINNMILRSKKKKCKIKMSINLTLPPVEVYNTISNVYEEGLAEKFINSLTSTIPIEEVRESISTGLGEYYKRSSNSVKNTEEHQKD